MSERHPMTKEGFERVAAELEELQSASRPEVVAAVAEARSHGDLSENAEYHAAREKLRLVDSRIAELAERIANADVIDPAALSGDTVRFGAHVRVHDETADIIREFRIVGEDEADAAEGRLSVRAPLARALMGKCPGDEIEIHGPGGERFYELLEVSFS